MAIRTFLNESSLWQDFKWFWKDTGFPILILLFVAVCIICAINIGLNHQDKNPITYRKLDGHEYVIYKYGFQGGITHSPRCECLTNSVSSLQKE